MVKLEVEPTVRSVLALICKPPVVLITELPDMFNAAVLPKPLLLWPTIIVPAAVMRATGHV